MGLLLCEALSEELALGGVDDALQCRELLRDWVFDGGGHNLEKGTRNLVAARYPALLQAPGITSLGGGLARSRLSLRSLSVVMPPR